MRRTTAILTLLALIVVAAALVYQAAAQERDYREQLGRGDAARRDNQIFTAIEAYSGAIALRPDAVLPHLRRGEAYQQRGDYDASTRDFRMAATLDPSATRPLEELGDVLYERQRFAAAAGAYEQRLRLDDRAPAVTYKLALARYRRGDVDGALTAATDASRFDDRMAAAQYLRGLCLRDKKRLPDAIEAFERAIALDPGMIPAREELADIHATLAHRADELEQLQMLAGLDRGRIDRQVAVDLAHARHGDGELAVIALGGALARTEDQTVIYSALGQVWLDMTSSRSDALAKALQALEQAALPASAPSDVLTRYGRALVEDGQLDLAERVLRQATERFPVDPAAFLEFANVAERLTHFDVARDALVGYRALATNPDAPGDIPFRIESLSRRAADLAAVAAKRNPAGAGRSGPAVRRQ